MGVTTEMAPRVLAHPGTRPTENRRLTVDTNILRNTPEKVAAPADERPHGCYDGWVYLGFEGEEVEVFEAVLCRRCSAAETDL